MDGLKLEALLHLCWLSALRRFQLRKLQETNGHVQVAHGWQYFTPALQTNTRQIVEVL